MRPFLVYRLDNGNFGYNSVSSQTGGELLMKAWTGRDHVHQTWVLDAWNGKDAIKRVKGILRAASLKGSVNG